jgi:hypothetical protein
MLGPPVCLNCFTVYQYVVTIEDGKEKISGWHCPSCKRSDITDHAYTISKDEYKRIFKHIEEHSDENLRSN